MNDFSQPAHEKRDRNLIKIRFVNDDGTENIIEINFLNLYIESIFLHNKYKYPEARTHFQTDISEAQQQLNIKPEIIKQFLQTIDHGSSRLPVTYYTDIRRLSDYFNVPNLVTSLTKINISNFPRDGYFNVDLGDAQLALQRSRHSRSSAEESESSREPQRTSGVSGELEALKASLAEKCREAEDVLKDLADMKSELALKESELSLMEATMSMKEGEIRKLRRELRMAEKSEA